MAQVKKVEYWWDAQDSDNAGWYARTIDAERQIIDDSEKVWFPVDVAEYGYEQSSELAGALRDAFPGAKIVEREG